MGRKLLPMLVLICLAIALWWWLSRGAGKPDRASTAADKQQPAQPSASRSSVATDQPAAAPASTVGVRRMKSAAEREQLLERIRAAQAERARDAGAAEGEDQASAGDDPLAGPRRMSSGGYKDYIQNATREIVPLIAECYEMGLLRTPDLAGRITVEFTIEGEPEVGGLIGTSTVDAEQSTITDAEVLECVQETMYAIEIDPPEGGGVVTVRYPFQFSTGNQDGGAGQ